MTTQRLLQACLVAAVGLFAWHPVAASAALAVGVAAALLGEMHLDAMRLRAEGLKDVLAVVAEVDNLREELRGLKQDIGAVRAREAMRR